MIEREEMEGKKEGRRIRGKQDRDEREEEEKGWNGREKDRGRREKWRRIGERGRRRRKEGK